ncbi:FAD-binding oxidoreductase [Glycomyces xiaoerkulensis]|uniref:FAD-binding oxidoreductase n=1 Tax=Glycomyces xiaoerkulensis TaxID=2038139 RepID=UPI000C2633AA|nr:FAD-binding oxidoreductase [Glycomyces xiaoerkulensis]
MSIENRESLANLHEVVRGRVLLPSEEGFDLARRPWNVAVEQQVRAVVEAADEHDVAALVDYASRAGLSISTQPNGHGATGSASGTILLRTGRLDGVEIDPAARRARIGAGVQSGSLQAAAAEHGLTGLPGSSPVVSVAGVALGGGLSWFGRAFGWVADGVTAFEVVDAAGKARTVSAANEPDLFWALRGGGGDYAIVTALEVELHEAPELFGGRVLWPASHARAVAEAFRSMTAAAPDELTLWLELLHFPGAEPMVAIDSTYLGPEADARSLLAEIDRLPEPLSDTRAAMSAAEIGTITGEPTDPSPGRSRAELLTHLDEAALGALLDEPISPLMTVQVRHLGGALALGGDGPHGPLREPFAVYFFGSPADPASSEAMARKQRTFAEALPVSGRKPLSFLNPSEDLTDALPGRSVERLRAIKERHDPAGTIRGNFAVPGTDGRSGS